MKRDIQEISISEIDLDTSQPRQVIEEDKLKDLAEDMAEAGQLVPIILTPCYKKGETLVVGNGAYVKEMARAIERYAEVWKRNKKIGNITKRLSKLTGYSTTYFKMAKALVDEPNKVIKKAVEEDKIGPYYSAEKKASTKDKSIKDGMDEAVEEYIHKNPKKRVGALTPRVLKPEFKKIEKKVKDPITRRKIAKAKTLEYLNRSIEVVDENPNYEKYLYDSEEFYEKVLRWNLKGLTIQQVENISETIMKSVTYLKEEKRKLGKFKHPKRKGRNM